MSFLAPGSTGEWLLRAVGVTLALSLHAGVSAQGEAGTMKSIVVTATRTEKTVQDTPIRTEVVDREELTRTHALTLTQALQDVPGLQMREVHGKSGHEVTMQGLTSDQVLILVDGLPITPSTGSTVDLSQYLLADVERIEVVKGATSAQYGSSAMGGVVNVITRRIRPGLAAAVSADAGTRGSQNARGGAAYPALRRAQAQVEGGGEVWRWRLHAGVLDDVGFAVDPAGWARQGDAVTRSQTGGRLEWLPSRQTRLWVDASQYLERGRQRYDYVAPPNLVPQRKVEDIHRRRLSSGGTWTLPQGARLEAKGLHERYDSASDGYSSGLLLRERRAAQRTSQLGLQLDLPPWRRQLWQVGVDWRRESLSQRSNGVSELEGAQDPSRSSHELFVQNDILFNDTWEMLLGMRWQRDSDFGSHIAPKASLRAHLPALGDWSGVARVSFGHGYRVPNLKERHFLFDHSALGYRVVGNPALRPESSNSLQAGIALSRSERLALDLNLFDNHVEDLIQVDEDHAVTVNQVTTYTYRNVARARTRGMEAGVRWQPMPTLDLRAAYTLTQARDLGTGQDLTRRPRHMVRAGLDWRWHPDLALSLRGRWQGSERVDSVSGQRSPGWATLDLKLNWQVGPQTTAYLGIDNLFDRQRAFDGAQDFGPLSGRLVYLGLKHGFGHHP